MQELKRAVYYFCSDSKLDPVGSRIFNEVTELANLENTGIIIDENPVLKYLDVIGNEFQFVRTYKPVCHDYPYYLPIMNKYYPDYDMAGLVTWHEGQNAPDRVLSVHSTGDVDSGNFGAAEPLYMRNLLLALEKNRVESCLDSFRVVTEATHWSGMIYDGGHPELIPEYKVPIIDIEIGSSPDSWADKMAARVLAKSLFSIFSSDNKKIYNILCAGGVHFEPAFVNAVLQDEGDKAFAISHIIPNQWLVSGKYEEPEGLEKLEKCLETIKGGIKGIAFHDGLKGVYKEQMRTLAKRYNIPAFKHQLLRRPNDIAWTE